eukprot:TRINITY_DN598_c0_g1_i1.p1 TRINITY_DN598_c0_g1~~TRINITY_DN598_c0_g1_i1.p1  ORF type:complete len:430 (-),score=65.40 TRINITY_DN598_c0_g1_i1:31-1320(-)
MSIRLDPIKSIADEENILIHPIEVQHILIIGGGISGLSVIKQILKSFLKSPNSISPFFITLVNPYPFFYHRSLLLGILDRFNFLDLSLLNVNCCLVRVIIDRVVLVESDRAILQSGLIINFDYLVVACGCFQSSRLNSLLSLRGTNPSILVHRDWLHSRLTNGVCVCIGSGIFSAEIICRIRLRYPTVRIIHIFEENTICQFQNIHLTILRSFRKRNIEIFSNTRVLDVNSNTISTDKIIVQFCDNTTNIISSVQCDVLFLVNTRKVQRVGQFLHPIFDSCFSLEGLLNISQYLELSSFDSVFQNPGKKYFACGSINSRTYNPRLSLVHDFVNLSMLEGKIVGKNIFALLKGKEKKRISNYINREDFQRVISLGKTGVAFNILEPHSFIKTKMLAFPSIYSFLNPLNHFKDIIKLCRKVDKKYGIVVEN